MFIMVKLLRARITGQFFQNATNIKPTNWIRKSVDICPGKVVVVVVVDCVVFTAGPVVVSSVPSNIRSGLTNADACRGYGTQASYAT